MDGAIPDGDRLVPVGNHMEVVPKSPSRRGCAAKSPTPQIASSHAARQPSPGWRCALSVVQGGEVRQRPAIILDARHLATPVVTASGVPFKTLWRLAWFFGRGLSLPRTRQLGGGVLSHSAASERAAGLRRAAPLTWRLNGVWVASKTL